MEFDFLGKENLRYKRILEKRIVHLSHGEKIVTPRLPSRRDKVGRDQPSSPGVILRGQAWSSSKRSAVPTGKPGGLGSITADPKAEKR